MRYEIIAKNTIHTAKCKRICNKDGGTKFGRSLMPSYPYCFYKNTLQRTKTNVTSNQTTYLDTHIHVSVSIRD